MDESTYRELMKRARNDLAIAIEKRRGLVASLEASENEIAQLKRLIGGIYAYADQIDEVGELLCAGEGLKEAICTALRAASGDVTISEILDILKELQFPIERHQNPLGSVYTDVTGEICTRWNERESTWRKSGSCQSKGTSQSRS